MIALSAAVPTVRRRQFASNGCIVETFLIKTLRSRRPAKVRAASCTRTSTMLASLSQHFSMPGMARRAATSALRCSRSWRACSANTGACSRANSAASQLSTLTL